MDSKIRLARVPAVAGTVLVWFPILATVLLTGVRSGGERGLHIDYLMPAELFPVAFVGAGLLLWAALRSGFRRRLIAGGFALMVGFLVSGQLLAVATGLATGAREPSGWPWALVVASIVGYTLTLIALGVAGGFLVRDLRRPGAA